MNRVYKIVWSKAKNAYVVTSELAKNHTKSASGKAVKAALTAAVGMGVLMGGYAADAAAKDIVDKGGNPIAYDISPENDGTNIAIGKMRKSSSAAVRRNLCSPLGKRWIQLIGMVLFEPGGISIVTLMRKRTFRQGCPWGKIHMPVLVLFR